MCVYGLTLEAGRSAGGGGVGQSAKPTTTWRGYVYLARNPEVKAVFGITNCPILQAWARVPHNLNYWAAAISWLRASGAFLSAGAQILEPEDDRVYANGWRRERASRIGKAQEKQADCRTLHHSMRLLAAFLSASFAIVLARTV